MSIGGQVVRCKMTLANPCKSTPNLAPLGELHLCKVHAYIPFILIQCKPSKGGSASVVFIPHSLSNGLQWHGVHIGMERFHFRLYNSTFYFHLSSEHTFNCHCNVSFFTLQQARKLIFRHKRTKKPGHVQKITK